MGLSIVYYEIVIQLVAEKRPVLNRISHLHHSIVKSNDEELILGMLDEVTKLYDTVESSAETLYGAFLVIEWLCIMNLTFLVQNAITLLFS